MTETVDLLIVGGGLAAVTVARFLRQAGDRRSIVLASEERHVPYDRPPLSKEVLSGAMPADASPLLSEEELTGLAIDMRLGLRAVRLAPDANVVDFADGRTIEARDVVVATGSRARVIDVFGSDVHYLRTRDDVNLLHPALVQATDVVVIGAGFIGLEVAAVARGLGKAVTVLESAPEPLARVLGPEAGRVVAQLHEEHGVTLRCAVGVASVDRIDGRSHVALSDGETLSADVVVVGVGAVPCTEWLDGSGVTTDNGVVCDGAGRSSRPGVWAAGDVARWPNATTGLHARVEQWQSALDQAQIVASNLRAQAAGEPLVEWQSVPYFWSDQYGVKIQFGGHPGTESEAVAGTTKPVVLFRDGSGATGILTLDNPRLLAKGRRLIASGASYDELRELATQG